VLIPHLRRIGKTPSMYIGPRRGDVFSYLYFDPSFIEHSIERGRRDAQRHLDKAPRNGLVPWTTQ
jgi:NTE family protein